MEYLQMIIAILLVLLIVLALYVVVSWTLWKKTRQLRTKLAREEDATHTKVAAVYAQENMPKISIATVQPRPEFPSESLDSIERDELSESDHPDLGRLYFSLRYDPHRSVLIVRLARAEDIPIEPEASGTFVDVHLLPLNIQNETFEPYDTSISVSFLESYEFPLTKHELAVQTLDFHICRYDRYSRRTALGDVFLALAELGAQGIDLSREVFLCRNIISSQQVYSAVEKKRLYPTDGYEEELKGDGEPEEKKMPRSTKTDAGSPWKILRSYVRSGKYRKFFGLETAMHWEPLFTAGETSSVEGAAFYSAASTPAESKERTETERDTLTRFFSFQPDDAEENSSSSQTSPLQISPAPKDYYKIVPITPFLMSGPGKTPGKRGQTRTPLQSWQLPVSSTSHDDDDVQTPVEICDEHRAVPSAPLSLKPDASANEKGPSRQPETRGGKIHKVILSKGARQTKGAVSGIPIKRSRKVTPSPRRKKSSPRSERRAEARSSARKSTSSAESSKASKRKSSQSSLSSASGSSLSESSRLLAEPSKTFQRMGRPLQTEESRTPLSSPFLELGLNVRSQSNPNMTGGGQASEADSGKRRPSSTGDTQRDSEDEGKR